MTEVVILGSGTCVPSVRRAGPAACLRTGGVTVLVDSAAGTLRQMAAAGIAMDSVDHIFYTHLHPDHVGEFVPFVFASKYGPGCRREKGPVTVWAAQGFERFHKGLMECYGGWASPDPGTMVIEELPVHMVSSTQAPPLVITASPVKHTPMSLAYRVETPVGEKVGFSGDTDYCQEIIELARGADILVLECACPEGKKVEGHLMPSEAGRIAAEAGVKRLVLTHFYPECDKADAVTPCRNHYTGSLLLAQDLMRVVLA